MQSNVDLVRDLVLAKILEQKPFSVGDIVYDFAHEKGRHPSEVARDLWESIRTCVRDMRGEFMDVEEFYDSSGMPYPIVNYTRTKIETDLCPEPVNVYHPSSMNADDIQWPEFEHGATPKWPTQEEGEQMAEKLLGKINQQMTEEPKTIEKVMLNEDGSLTIPAEIMKRVGDLQSDNPILCLKVARDLFNHFRLMD